MAGRRIGHCPAPRWCAGSPNPQAWGKKPEGLQCASGRSRGIGARGPLCLRECISMLRERPVVGRRVLVWDPTNSVSCQGGSVDPTIAKESRYSKNSDMSEYQGCGCVSCLFLCGIKRSLDEENPLVMLTDKLRAATLLCSLRLGPCASLFRLVRL